VSQPLIDAQDVFSGVVDAQYIIQYDPVAQFVLLLAGSS